MGADVQGLILITPPAPCWLPQGPMYPKGYVVINTNVTYLEKEDELDKEVKVREDSAGWSVYARSALGGCQERTLFCLTHSLYFVYL